MLQKQHLEYIQSVLETVTIKSALWTETWNLVQREIEDINQLTRDKIREDAEQAERSEFEESGIDQDEEFPPTQTE